MSEEVNQLCKDAIDVAVHNCFLVPIEVQNLDDGTKEALMCSPDVTAVEFKAVLRARLGDESSATIVKLLDENNQHVFGSIPLKTAPTPTPLLYHVALLDPHVQSLFDLVGMGEEEERDRMMHRMASLGQRDPRDCPGNHLLPVAQPSSGGNTMMCAKCAWYAFRGQGCPDCDYALCYNCLGNDDGFDLSSMDPYDECIRIAEGIGKTFAGVIHGSGFGLHSTSVRWSSSLGEIRPTKLFPDDPRAHGPWVRKDTQMLPHGIRLAIRFSNKLRKVISGSECDMGLLPGETNEVLPNGATLADLQRLGQKLRNDKDVWQKASRFLGLQGGWQKVTRFLRECVQGKFDTFEDTPEAYVMTIKLVSFQPDHVTYEVGAEISSGFLVSARNTDSRIRRCGYSIGLDCQYMHKRLVEAGAVL